MQMGLGIRQSIADVDTDSLLSQNWPPSPSVRWRSCSETDSATMEKSGKKRTERYGIPNFRRFRKSLATSTVHTLWKIVFWPKTGNTMQALSSQRALQSVWASLEVLR